MLRKTAPVTQILGAIRQGYLFQTSDRRLSWLGPELRPADHRSNKSLILVSRNAVSLIGYTGTASIGKLPTDDWLAGAICATGQPEWHVPTHNNDLSKHTVDGVVRNLERHVDALRRRLPANRLRDFHLIVQIVGYRARRRRLLPFGFVLEWYRDRPLARGHSRPLAASYQDGVVLATPYLSGSLASRVAAELGRSAPGPADFHNNMASAMTEVALAREGVGDELLGIALEARSLRGFLVYRFNPDTAAMGPTALPLFPTPWVVGPGHAHQPALMSGDGELGYAGLALRLQLPTTDRAPERILSTVKWTLDRSLNPSADPIAHHFPFSKAEVHLEAGEHTMVTRFGPAPYRPPKR